MRPIILLMFEYMGKLFEAFDRTKISFENKENIQLRTLRVDILIPCSLFFNPTFRQRQHILQREHIRKDMYQPDQEINSNIFF